MSIPPISPPGPRPLLPSSAGWVLSAGLALTLLGLVTPSQTQSTPDDPVRFPTSGFGTSDSNGSMIAVTAPSIVGGSILYLVDTEHKTLAVYSADDGGASRKGIELIGARNISLDLRLDGYRDKSEWKYKELLQKFEEEDRDDSDG